MADSCRAALLTPAHLSSSCALVGMPCTKANQVMHGVKISVCDKTLEVPRTQSGMSYQSLLALPVLVSHDMAEHTLKRHRAERAVNA